MGAAGRCAGWGWQSSSLHRVLSAQPRLAEGFREAEEVSGKVFPEEGLFGAELWGAVAAGELGLAKAPSVSLPSASAPGRCSG